MAHPPVPAEVPPVKDFAEEEKEWRRPRIEKQDVTRFGVTVGCPGCVAAARGNPARNHTDACRNRMEQDMIRCQDKRIDWYNQRIMEASERILEGGSRGKRVRVGLGITAESVPTPPRNGVLGNLRAEDEDMPDAGGASSSRDAPQRPTSE